MQRSRSQKDKLYPYPTTLTNRFYINGLTGIPPGGSVTDHASPLYAIGCNRSPYEQ